MMRNTLLVLSSCLCLVLSGCQQLSTAPQISPSHTVQAHHFKITGKIGVRTPQQNGSAFYGWTQRDQQFAIDLTGALGIGQTLIRGKPGEVSLNSSKTGTLQAASAEELLLQATGWQAPISYLVFWIEAQPATATAILEKDASGRISSIQEGGWHATLSYAGQETLPNKLLMVDASAQNRVTLTIQSRE
jgi:outer membrane lipoprotein LolB